MVIQGLLWSSRGWFSKEAEFRKIAGSYDICIVTELKNKRTDRIKLPGFGFYVANSYNNERIGAGGAGIFIRRNIRRQTINLEHCLTDYDACGVHIKGSSFPINISVYNRPGRNIGRRS